MASEKTKGDGGIERSANELAYELTGPIATLGKVMVNAFIDDGGKNFTGTEYAADEPTPAELCEMAGWVLRHASSDLAKIGISPRGCAR